MQRHSLSNIKLKKVIHMIMYKIMNYKTFDLILILKDIL